MAGRWGRTWLSSPHLVDTCSPECPSCLLPGHSVLRTMTWRPVSSCSAHSWSLSVDFSRSHAPNCVPSSSVCSLSKEPPVPAVAGRAPSWPPPWVQPCTLPSFSHPHPHAQSPSPLCCQLPRWGLHLCPDCPAQPRPVFAPSHPMSYIFHIHALAAAFDPLPLAFCPV